VTCRHCRDPGRTVNRPRGLCWTCFYAPGVRALYPSTSKYANRGTGHGGGGFGLPDAPTPFAPGTPGKLAVLEGRAAAKVALWHPLDARYEGDPRPLLFGVPGGLHYLTPVEARAVADEADDPADEADDRSDW
jgi:hypothetical protein